MNGAVERNCDVAGRWSATVSDAAGEGGGGLAAGVDGDVSSASESAIKCRSDLTARQQYYLGTSYWIVKEPVGLNYFRFQEEEYAILNMLDGRTSLDQIKEQFEPVARGAVSLFADSDLQEPGIDARVIHPRPIQE